MLTFEDLWQHYFFRFSSGLSIRNMLCSSWLTYLGCPEYSVSELASKLSSIDKGLRNLVKDSKKYAEDLQQRYTDYFVAQREQKTAEVMATYAKEIQQAEDVKRYVEDRIVDFNKVKNEVESKLKWIGVCKYQDTDSASGLKMRMLHQIDSVDTKLTKEIESANTQLAISEHNAQLPEHTLQLADIAQPKCSYLGPGGGDYRGLADKANGEQCLPWPKSWAAKYHGSGLAKDILACTDIPMGSRCWEACIGEQETNKYCRNPTDARGPFCRTGGTEEAPVFSQCETVFECPDTGCTHDKPDASDYRGEIDFTITGSKCKVWKEDAMWRAQALKENWKNYCRNPGMQPTKKCRRLVTSRVL